VLNAQAQLAKAQAEVAKAQAEQSKAASEARRRETCRKMPSQLKILKTPIPP
jgi:multidrug resistance efflux pump